MPERSDRRDGAVAGAAYSAFYQRVFSSWACAQRCPPPEAVSPLALSVFLRRLRSLPPSLSLLFCLFSPFNLAGVKEPNLVQCLTGLGKVVGAQNSTPRDVSQEEVYGRCGPGRATTMDAKIEAVVLLCHWGIRMPPSSTPRSMALLELLKGCNLMGYSALYLSANDSQNTILRTTLLCSKRSTPVLKQSENGQAGTSSRR